MKKQLLLAAAAVTALVAAGSANAASVSYRATVGGASNDATATPYTLASELNFAAGITSTVGQFDTIVVANTPIPAGTYTVRFDFLGASINAQVPNLPIVSGAAVVDADITGEVGFGTTTGGGGSTLTLVSGGTVGSTSVTYTLQVPAGQTVTQVGISPALRVVGAVSVTAGIRNQVGNAFYEPAVIQNLILVSAQPAFGTRVNGRITAADAVTFGSGAGVDTRIDDGILGDPFNTFTVAGVNQIGQVDVAVAGTAKYDVMLSRATASTTVKRNLTNGDVTLADVTSAAINMQGNLAGLTFSGAGAAPLTGTATGAASVTLSGAPDVAAANAAYTLSAVPTSALARAAQLNPTDLPVSVTLTLNALFAPQTAFTGQFETIQTDGISYIVPWVNSAAFGNITGSTNTIRISHIGNDSGNLGGRVYGQLYNPSNLAGVVTTSRSFNFGTIGGRRQLDSQTTNAGNNPTRGTEIAPGVPAGGPGYASGVPSTSNPGELLITSTELQNAFGDFGRGDLRLTITDTGAVDPTIDNDSLATLASSIIVRRLVRSANGGLTEIAIAAGNAGANNIPNDQNVPY